MLFLLSHSPELVDSFNDGRGLMSFAFAQGQSELVELVFNRQRGRSAIGGRVEPPSLWPPDSDLPLMLSLFTLILSWSTS